MSYGGGPDSTTSDRYVSQSAGNDANPGTAGAPWQTLAKVNAAALLPGANVYLKRGDTWHEQLTVPFDNMSVDAYGSGARPIIDGDNVRENLIYMFSRRNCAVRNIEVINSQSNPDGGYGVLLHNCVDCLVEDVKATNNSKHSIGLIESHRCTVRRAEGGSLQLGLGVGNATTFVSYGESYPMDNVWEDCVSTTGDGGYPTFITHGAGVRNITVTNMVENTDVSAFCIFSEPGARVAVSGGSLKGVTISSGVGATFDNVTVEGRLFVDGTNHRFSNCDLTYLDTDWTAGRPGVLLLRGTGTVIEDSIVTTGLAAVSGSAVAIGPVGGGTIQRCTLIGIVAIRVQYDGPIHGLTSDNNLWCTIGVAQQGSGAQTGYLFAQWQALGFDVHSTTQVCS